MVLTDLHNFAMPLVRYEIGDYAEAGGPCPCGRGLPVLRRIIGRVRNMLVTASGDRLWPYFGARHILDVAPILQQQFVQKDYDLIEARFVTEAPLGAEQENRLRHLILSGPADGDAPAVRLLRPDFPRHGRQVRRLHLRSLRTLTPSAPPPVWDFRSAFPGAVWPAVPDPAGASMLSLLYQLGRSQWHSADELHAFQLKQLALLLRHARETVPFYRERAGTAAHAGLAQLPVLTRRELRDNFELLKAERFPAGHGPVGEARTSGATGAPVRILKTQLCLMFWNALTLRDHLWHRRELAGKLAVIRHGVRAGESASWGPATEGIVATGSSVMLTPESSVDEQLRWLARQRPAYLLTYPSLVAELARASCARGMPLPGLLEVPHAGRAARSRSACAVPRRMGCAAHRHVRQRRRPGTSRCNARSTSITTFSRKTCCSRCAG